MKHTFTLLAALLLEPLAALHADGSEKTAAPPIFDEGAFANPPAAARVGVWWRWINGNVTREGITRDLTEMARKGIRSVDVFDVDGGAAPGPAAMMGPLWRSLFQHALAEAARLGIEVRLVAAAGWGMGGPWVDAAHAAKKLSFAEIQADGPKRLDLFLPKPLGAEPFYQDVAVVAFREKADAPLRPAQVVASSEQGNYCTDEKNAPAEDVADRDPDTCWQAKDAPSAVRPAWVELRYHEALKAAAVLVASPAGCGPGACELQVPQESGGFTAVLSFSLAAGETRRVQIPPTVAKAFRLSIASAHVPDVRMAEFCVLREGDAPGLRRGIQWWMFKSGKRAFWDWPKQGPAVLAEEYAGPELPDCRSAETIELTRRMDGNGRLVWDVPPGRWAIARFGATLVGEPPRAMSRALKGGYEADPYSPGAADLLYDQTAGVVLKEARPEARQALKGVLIDSYEIGASAFGLQATWTDGFREAFRKSSGYDLAAYLPALARRVVDGRRETNRFFWDYRQVLAQRYLDFYARLAERAHRDGLRVRAENGYGTYPFPHIDGLAAFGRIDEPMGEFWFNDGGPWGLIMKQHFHYADSVRTAASAARIYGKPLVAAESLTIADGTRQAPAAWKAELDAQFCSGLNNAMLHLWSHQPDVDARPGLFTYDAINANMTWWEQSDAFLDYIGRCQLLLRQGRFVADFCYFFGEDTARFVPGRKHVRPALPAGYDFDGINAEVILSRLACRQGLATLPDGQAYRYLVLPEAAAWPVTLPVLEKIAELAEDGLTVIGARPGPSPRLRETEKEGIKRQKLVNALWGEEAAARVDRRVGKGRVIAGTPLAELLASERLSPDVAPCGAPDPGWEAVTWIHRRTEDSDLYFLANTGTGSVRQAVSFRVTGRTPELWDPVTGTRHVLSEWSASGEGTTVPLLFEPAGSLFVVFRARGQGTEESAQKGEKNFPDFTQAMELTGPWQVTFDPKWFYPVGSQQGQSAVVFEMLMDWTLRPEEAIKYYAGTATFRKTFDFTQVSSPQLAVSSTISNCPLSTAHCRLDLDLGVVHNVAQVRLNGENLGTVWCAPWRIEVTGALKPGENQLEIDVVNLWHNRLVGDSARPAGQRLTRTNLAVPASQPLLPSGLLGPVRIVKAEAAGTPVPSTDASEFGAAAKQKGVSFDSVPFTSGKEGYACYRCPTLVVSAKGTVLAFCEGRVNGHKDEDDMDVVLKRSTDGGRTWGPLQVLANDGRNPCKNQCPIVLPSGRILLVWLWNKWIPSESDRTTREVFVMHSDDDGATWSKPRNITKQVYRDGWRWYGTGPCHGIVKRSEPNKGRVVVAARHNAKDSHMFAHLIYSDDNGDTWQIGGSVPREKTSEATVAELSNGDLMINCRNQNDDEDHRVVSVSKDGGATFTETWLETQLVEPRGCQASLLFHSLNSATGKGNILFSNPANEAVRSDGTLKLSEDDARTWAKSFRYAKKPAPNFTGYSDLAVMPDGSVAVLYERGELDDASKKSERYDEIGFTVVPFADICAPLPPVAKGAAAP